MNDEPLVLPDFTREMVHLRRGHRSDVGIMQEASREPLTPSSTTGFGNGQMVAIRRISIAIIAFLIVVVLSACSLVNEPIRKTQILGKWRGSHGSEVVIESDGTATFINLPAAAISLNARGLVDGRTKWIIENNKTDNDVLFIGKAMSPAKYDLKGWQGFMTGASNSKLYFYLADPDLGKQLTLTRS